MEKPCESGGVGETQRLGNLSDCQLMRSQKTFCFQYEILMYVLQWTLTCNLNDQTGKVLGCQFCPAA